MNDIPTVKDSGVRENFSTGSVRDTRAGKGRYDLLPTRAMRRVARHFEAGAVKYGDRNWERGQPISRYMDSGLRHAFSYLEGKRDEDHLAAAAWNILAAIETEERVRSGILSADLDDVPNEELDEELGGGSKLDETNSDLVEYENGQQVWFLRGHTNDYRISDEGGGFLFPIRINGIPYDAPRNVTPFLLTNGGAD